MFSEPPPISLQRRGFVLVMVLVLILVTSITAAGFARKSFELARTVADAQEDLQRRWGMRSLERLALANPANFLDGIDVSRSNVRQLWPLRQIVDVNLTLGELRFVVRLSDEDAKIDLNTLARRERDPQNLLSSVTQQAAGPSGLPVAVRWPPRDPENEKAVAFQTWEQVFDLRGESQADEIIGRLQAATVQLTCWGTGKLNLSRAQDSTVRLLLTGAVSENSISRVLGVRRQGGFEDIDTLVKKINLNNKDEAVLKRLLAVDSKRFAVWITVQSARRTWASLTIDRSGNGNPSSFETFHW
ncbi:type II secretion system protein GspK [Schlesneria paludicola]|uniref:type II secretion system protein GspK n=1 Tax=Schlesneria paludicola TaxID=360056 RepID=UPI00029A1371|nr:type II secretion system protein GspK [Schlesneria paludicola]